MAQDAFRDAVKRDRFILIGGLVGIGGLAWACMVRMSAGMEGAHSCHVMVMPHIAPWGIREALMAFGMWAAMMAAMMLPIVSPWLLMLSRTKRERDPRPAPFGVAGFFLLGYMAMWMGYGALAALGQLGLHKAALLSPKLVGTSPTLGGGLLIAAGGYQWTPLRDACMKHCRSPMSFFLTSWRDGCRGAFSMGFRHGLYCVGCCWALMALSFVFGVMNLLWMAGLTIFILSEKVTPRGPWIGRVGGVLLIGLGLWMLGSGLAAA